MSALLTNSSRQFGIKIEPNRRSINPVEWFCLNIKFQVLGFLILQISQMSKLSFISTNFAIDFHFKSGLPPFASSFDLKKMLKSSAKIMRLF